MVHRLPHQPRHPDCEQVREQDRDEPRDDRDAVTTEIWEEMLQGADGSFLEEDRERFRLRIA
jgi:hypothetical protein